MSIEIAYCYRSGEIGFVLKGERVPDGAKTLAMGPSAALRQAIDVVARHGYSPGVLLVPGLPEAYGDLEAVEATVWFIEQVEKRL